MCAHHEKSCLTTVRSACVTLSGQCLRTMKLCHIVGALYVVLSVHCLKPCHINVCALCKVLPYQYLITIRNHAISGFMKHAIPISVDYANLAIPMTSHYNEALLFIPVYAYFVKYFHTSVCALCHILLYQCLYAMWNLIIPVCALCDPLPI